MIFARDLVVLLCFEVMSYQRVCGPINQLRQGWFSSTSLVALLETMVNRQKSAKTHQSVNRCFQEYHELEFAHCANRYLLEFALPTEKASQVAKY